jgi:PAS domain S-box-containing protein
MTGSHDLRLVALAVFLAFAASYTALDLMSRAREPLAGPKNAISANVWLWTAAVMLGAGIWTMHFVAMLAYSAPTLTWGYEVGLTALSLLLAVAATAIAFKIVDASLARRSFLIGGTIMGFGIAAMHYVGMAAMTDTVVRSYTISAVIASVAVAVGAATTALWVAFTWRGFAARVVGAAGMAVAISGMHFLGMMGLSMAASGSPSTAHSLHVGSPGLAVGVGIAAALMMVVALSASVADRRAVARSVAEAKAARSREELFRELYRQTPLPLHAATLDGELIEVSEAWLELLGYQRPEVIGQTLLNFMTPDSAKRRLEVDLPVLMAEGRLRNVEYQLLHKSGDVLDVECSSMIERQSGKPFRIIGGLVNVTARRRAEDALRQAHKMEALGQLTGGVAHDFNNLLAIIQGNLELLKRRVPTDERLVSLIDNALQGAQRGASLTQKMLSFARKQSLVPEAVAVGSLLTDLGSMLRQAAGPGITISSTLIEGLAVQADRNQLELAVLNLVVNARDAMGGSGRIELSMREDGDGREPERQYGVISVRDYGMGMDAATLERAREPFFTTKPVNKGSGLGLSMVHGFAEQSGGFLRLDSRPGEGTTAEIWLPSVAASSTQASASRSLSAQVPETDQAMNKVALAVDDDFLVLMNTVAMLEDLGWQVHSASSGHEALELLEEQSDIALIVTDQMMPGMTGLELAARAREADSRLCILVATGYLDLQQTGTATFPVLNKPFSTEQLRMAVEKCLSPRLSH